MSVYATLLQRKNPLAPWEKRSEKSKSRVDSDCVRLLRSQKLSLQAVDENTEVVDDRLPPLSHLNSPSSINEWLEALE